jgi:hypothetical protein
VPPQAVLAMRDRSGARRGGDRVETVSGGFRAGHDGRPLLTYRCLAGHGEANAAALEQQGGLVPWIKKRGDRHDGLAAALSRPTAQPWPTSGTFVPTVADAVVAGSPARSA